MLAKIRRPSLTAWTIDEKSSSSSTSALARDVRPPSSHRDPDVRRLQGRRVVHTVSRHRDDLAVCLERLDETELLLGDDPGKNVDVLDALAERLVGESVELGSGDHVVGGGEPHLPGDVPRGPGVVAGDHDDPDPRGVALLDRRADGGANGVRKTDEPDELESEVVLLARESRALETRLGHTENAQAPARERGDLRIERRNGVRAEVAEIDDRLRCAFCRDHEVRPVWRGPHARERQELFGERVLVDERPVAVNVLGFREVPVAELADRFFHRIEWIDLAREDPELDELVEALGYRRPPGTRRRRFAAGAGRVIGRGCGCAPHVEVRAARKKLGNRHPVLSESSRLVDAKHRRAPKRLDRGDAAGEDLALRDPPCPEREKYREHHGELFGERRHGERYSREKTVEPIVPREPVDNDNKRAERDPRDRKTPDEAAGLLLEKRLFGLDRPERLPDLSDLGSHANRPDLGDPLALDDQRARIDEREIVSAGCRDRRFLRGRAVARRGGHFPHRHRFAGEERFVDGKIERGEKRRVGGHAVAFLDDEKIAADHLAPRDPLLHTVAYHESARAGEISQRLERAFGLSLLIERDPHHDEDEEEEHERLLQIAEEEIEHAARDEHEEHRLAHDLGRNRKDAPPPCGRDLVEALLAQPAGGILFGEPRERLNIQWRIHESLSECRPSGLWKEPGPPRS
jgi:hypothetical protein